MAFIGGTFVATTTPAKLTVADGDYSPGGNLAVTNMGSVNVRVGGSGVTTTTGYRLPPGASASTTTEMRGATPDDLWIVAVSGTCEVDYLASGV